MVKPLKYRDAAKVLRARGWRHDSTRGSHEKWKHPLNPSPIILPAHPEISPGVIRSIARTLGSQAPKEWR
ncbi:MULTISPECIES: type II toxin-antitoxin system HicA family toxin [Dermabacter]|uniref:type II toxin-antitoxin system HicA family toxin n=1 Tax=Dermabacter TaxID=36739 RepID=UPI000A026AF6